MDALSELLRVIRLSGAAFIDAELSAPWAIETPTPSAIAARLAPGAKRIIPYHLVAEGGCYVQLKGQKPVELSASRIVMFPHGDVHVLTSAPGLSPLLITTDDVVKLTRPIRSPTSATVEAAGRQDSSAVFLLATTYYPRS